MIDPTHFAYSDESCYTTSDNFGAISILSFTAEIKSQLESTIFPFLGEMPNEYKWSKFESRNYLDVSKQIFDVLFQYAIHGQLRIDAIIWQTNDPRYPRNQTNSGEKLSVLYYIRLRDMLSKRWGADGHWAIFVDEQGQMNWEELESYLEYASRNKFASTLLGPKYDLNWLLQNHTKYSLEKLESVSSCDEPFVQIADIFAGMAAYSHNRSSLLLEWLQFDAAQNFENNTKQMAFPFLKRTEVSRREIWRNRFIN